MQPWILDLCSSSMTIYGINYGHCRSLYGGRPQPRGLCVRWGPSHLPFLKNSIGFNMGRQLDELLCVFFLATRHLCHITVLFFMLLANKLMMMMGPRLVPCGLRRGLLPFRTKRRLHPSTYLATRDMGQNWGVVVPFLLGVAGSTSNTMLRRPRSTYIGRVLPPYQVAS